MLMMKLTPNIDVENVIVVSLGGIPVRNHWFSTGEPRDWISLDSWSEFHFSSQAFFNHKVWHKQTKKGWETLTKEGKKIVRVSLYEEW